MRRLPGLRALPRPRGLAALAWLARAARPLGSAGRRARHLVLVDIRGERRSAADADEIDLGDGLGGGRRTDQSCRGDGQDAHYIVLHDPPGLLQARAVPADSNFKRGAASRSRQNFGVLRAPILGQAEALEQLREPRVLAHAGKHRKPKPRHVQEVEVDITAPQRVERRCRRRRRPRATKPRSLDPAGLWYSGAPAAPRSFSNARGASSHT